MSPPNDDARPEASKLWPYNSRVPRQLFSFPHLSSHYLTDKEQQVLCTGYFFHSLLPSSAFSSLNPFQHPSRHTLVNRYVHFTIFHVCSQSDVCGLTSSPHPLYFLCEITTQVGKQLGFCCHWRFL